jgi:hypothetical protein
MFELFDGREVTKDDSPLWRWWWLSALIGLLEAIFGG